MVDVGVLQPTAPRTLDQVRPWVGLVRDGLAGRWWQGESLALQHQQVLAALGGAGSGVPAGICVSLMALRHPYAAAHEAASAATLLGRDLVVCFGPGSPAVAQTFLDRPYRRPVTSAARYVDAVGRLLDGEVVAAADESWRVHARLPQWPRPGVSVGLGALRPAMTAAAGRTTDVAVAWMPPARYVGQHLRPALDRGHRERTRAGRCRLVGVVHVVVQRPGLRLAEVVRAATAEHLDEPHYRTMLVLAGVDVGAHGGVAGGLARRLVDGGAVLHGTPDEVVDQLGELAEAGLDEVVLNAVGVQRVHGDDAARRDVAAVLEAWAARAAPTRPRGWGDHQPA